MPKIVEQVGPDKEIVTRVIVLPTTDFDTVRAIGRRVVAAYLTVPAYAAFQEWLGRGDALRDMNAAWNAGDRARALELVPDALLDELIVHGSPAECARGVEEYVTAGVTTTAPMINAQGEQLREVLRARSHRRRPDLLARRAGANGAQPHELAPREHADSPPREVDLRPAPRDPR